MNGLYVRVEQYERCISLRLLDCIAAFSPLTGETLKNRAKKAAYMGTWLHGTLGCHGDDGRAIIIGEPLMLLDWLCTMKSTFATWFTFPTCAHDDRKNDQVNLKWFLFS